MNVIIIPCFSYNERFPEIGCLLINFVKKNIDKYLSVADALYLCGRGVGFEKTHTEVRSDGKEVRYIENDESRFQNNVMSCINTLSSGDKFVLVDLDTIIFDYSYFTDIFNDLNTYDVVSIFDGGQTKTTVVGYNPEIYSNLEYSYKEYPINTVFRLKSFQPNENRDARVRFIHSTFATSYDFFKSIMPEDSFLNEDRIMPNEHFKLFEPMEGFTYWTAVKRPNAKIKEIPHYKNILVCDPEKEDYGIKCVNDSENKLCTLENFLNAKHFHISGYGGTLSQYMREKIECHPFTRGNNQNITSISSTLRAIFWFIVISTKTYGEEATKKYLEYYENILKKECSLDINSPMAKEFFNEFKKLYRTHLL